MGHRCATILTVHLPQPLILSAVDFISRHFERYFPSIYTQPAHSLLTFLPFTSATTAPRPLPPPPPPPPSLSQTQLNFVVILLNLIFFLCYCNVDFSTDLFAPNSNKLSEKM
ncbi:hypothetical protein Drorol1_Dr00025390, partial [Drosera rotundifolia]